MICALLFGEGDSKSRVEQIAARFGKCPYVGLMTTKGTQLFAVFFLPRRQKWWIEYIEKKPRRTLGLRKARVTVVDHIQYPRRVETRRPKRTRKLSPCGSSCGTCPSYGRCLGCPSTPFYKHAQNNAK